MKKHTCETCQHFNVHPSDDRMDGDCWLEPPKVFFVPKQSQLGQVQLAFAQVWPRVNGDFRCSNFEWSDDSCPK